MESFSENKLNSGRDFAQFESFIVSVISEVMPNLNWKATKATRDGNRDAVSRFRHAILNECYEAWLEIKYRSDHSKSIASRSFDSTLVSALDADRLKALYFATNAQVSTAVHYRIKSFCERALPNLKMIKVYDGKYLEKFISKSHMLKIEDFIFDEIYIVNCIDFANHQLVENKSISSGDFQYVIASFYNPYCIEGDETNDKFSIVMNNVKVKEFDLSDGWNFPYIFFNPNLLGSSKSQIEIKIEYKGLFKSLTKNITIFNQNKIDIFYQDGLDLNTSFHIKHDSIKKGQLRRGLGVIEGGSGTGKTYQFDAMCATWSSTHEILPVQITGMASDWNNLDLIVNFVFGSAIGEPDATSSSAKDSNIRSLVSSLFAKSSRRQRKLVLIDDWHKADPNFISKAVDLIKMISELSEWVSVFIFSRKSIAFDVLHSALSYFEFFQLRGPTLRDIEASLKPILNRSASEGEIKLVAEVSPNLVNLTKILELIKSSLKDGEVIHSLIARLSTENLFVLPTLPKEELDVMSLVYLLPDGLSEDERIYLSIDASIIDSLYSNGVLRISRANSIRYFPIHDLWRDVIFLNYRLVNDTVLGLLEKLSLLNESRKYAYIAAAVSTTSSINSDIFKVARTLRDLGVLETKFGEVKYLSQAIVSSNFHSTKATQNINSSNEALILARDFLQAGNIFNHTSHYKTARDMLVRGKELCKKHLHNNEVSDLNLHIDAELTNLDYWSLDCEYITNMSLPKIKRDMSCTYLLSSAILMNRTMMANYLFDRVHEARSIRKIASKFCTKYNQLGEKIHLLMDAAKNEIIIEPTNALKLYSLAIKQYKIHGKETRRLSVALYQRESLRVKLGKSSIDKLQGLSNELERQGFTQEYMNSMIDIATIYAVLGESDKASAALNSVSSHPDIAVQRRLLFKSNQCRALIYYLNGENKKAIDSWNNVLGNLEKVGESYKIVPLHNMKQDSVKKISWYFGKDTLINKVIYVDPRLW